MEENINPFHPDNQPKIEYGKMISLRKNFYIIIIVLGCGITSYLIQPVPTGYLIAAALIAACLTFPFFIFELWFQKSWMHYSNVVLMILSQGIAAHFYKLRGMDPFLAVLMIYVSYFACYLLSYSVLIIILKKPLNKIIEAKAKKLKMESESGSMIA